MGYSISWVAVRGKSVEELQKTLGFKRTGRHDAYDKHLLTGRQLRNGWYLLMSNDCGGDLIEKRFLAKLSKGGEAVACSAEEHVMFSSCAFWTGGKLLWSLKHCGEEKIFNIDEFGELPESYPALKKKIIAKQKSEGGTKADVDYIFELPLLQAKQLVGFKHDEGRGAKADELYEVFDLKHSFKIPVPESIRPVLHWLKFIIGCVALLLLFCFVAVFFTKGLGWLWKTLGDYLSKG
jgi:hypothetical protein